MRNMKRELRVTSKLNHKSTIGEIYRREVSKTHPMTPDEEFEVAMRARGGDERAREKLIKANLRFVLSMAKNFSSDSTTMDDLISAGNFGLVEASGKFDPTKGFKFISYAVWHIRKEMLNYIYENSRTVKIPVIKSQLLARAKRAAGEFLAREGREPTSEEIVEWMNSQEGGKKVDGAHLQDILQADVTPLSLSSPLGEDGGHLSDVVGEEDSAFVGMFSDDSSGIRELMCSLQPREKFIVTKRFGLDGEEPWNFSEIGKALGRSGEWVRAHNARALKKMQIRGRKLYSGMGI
jgi:RNA polymerase primary sigma factor